VYILDLPAEVVRVSSTPFSRRGADPPSNTEKGVGIFPDLALLFICREVYHVTPKQPVLRRSSRPALRVLFGSRRHRILSFFPVK
jgi:hypothetical protein